MEKRQLLMKNMSKKQETCSHLDLMRAWPPELPRIIISLPDTTAYNNGAI